jgi:hypothetical protein
MDPETKRLCLLAFLTLPMLVCLLPCFLKKHSEKVGGFILFYGVTSLTGGFSVSGMIAMKQGSYYWAAGFYLLSLTGIILLLYRFNMEFLIPEKIRQKSPKTKPIITEIKQTACFLRDFYANAGFRVTEWSRRWLWSELRWPGKLKPAAAWAGADYRRAAERFVEMLCADVRLGGNRRAGSSGPTRPRQFKDAMARPVARIGAIILYNLPYLIATWMILVVGDRGAGHAILIAWCPVDLLLVFCEADPGAGRSIMENECDPVETFVA